MSTTVRFPTLQADFTFAVSPRQVTPYCCLLLLVAAIIAIVQGELPHSREVTFNSVQPGSPCGSEVKFDPMTGNIGQNLCFQMEAGIVQYYMQNLAAAVTAPKPFQKTQKSHPVLEFDELSNQSIPFQVIGSKHMSDATFAAIGSPQTVHMSDSGIVLTMTRLKVQGAKFIHRNAASAFGSFAVKSPNPLIFGPKLRISGILPTLGVPPADSGSAKYLPQPFQGYGTNYLLSYQIFPQFFQRPNGHADQLLRRRQSYLADFFSNLREEFLRSCPATVIRIPGNSFESCGIETMSDPANPSRCAVAMLSDVSIVPAAAGQQDNSGVSGVDSVGRLSFHTMKFLSFPGFELPCYYFVHDGFSTFYSAGPSSRSGEPLYTICCAGASSLYYDAYKCETL